MGKKHKFEVIDGGKTDDDDNWLQACTIGTVFLARERQQPMLSAKPPTSGLQEFDVDEKTEKSVKLTQHVSGQEMSVWVDSLRFSRQMELVEKL